MQTKVTGGRRNHPSEMITLVADVMTAALLVLPRHYPVSMFGAPLLVTIRDLRPVFEQWDADGSGALEIKELQRGFLAGGIEPSDWDSVFGELDVNGDQVITFEEFEANITTEQREKIEAKLNEEGVFENLYVEPEKWSDATGHVDAVEQLKQQDAFWKQRLSE